MDTFEIQEQLLWIVQVDMAGHSRWANSLSIPDAAEARYRFRAAVTNAFRSYGFGRVAWQGDGGFFAGPVSATPNQPPIDTSKLFEATDAAMKGFREWKRARNDSIPIGIRISVHIDSIFTHPDPGIWYSDELNSFLKFEYLIGEEGIVTITDKVYKRVRSDDADRWKFLRKVSVAPQLEWRVYADTKHQVDTSHVPFNTITRDGLAAQVPSEGSIDVQLASSLASSEDSVRNGSQGMLEVRPDNADEFVRAIGSNTRIFLKANTYDLSSATAFESEIVKCMDVFDGTELLIRNISNLEIIGEPGTILLVKPRYSWVLSFFRCKSITLKILTLGHAPAGHCAGGVLGFSQSQDINIQKCLMFGSGTKGIEVNNTSNFIMCDSTIERCTYGLVEIRNSKHVKFLKTIFKETGEFNLVELWGECSDIVIDESEFIENYADKYELSESLFWIDDRASLVLQNSKFRGNRAGKFIHGIGNFTMKGNVFHRNTFNDYSDEELFVMNQ